MLRFPLCSYSNRSWCGFW